MNRTVNREGKIYKQIVATLLLLVVSVGSGSIGLLWKQRSVEMLILENASLERQIAEEERWIRSLDTKIAQIHHPRYLEKQNRLLALELVPPSREAVVFMDTGYDSRELGLQIAREEPVREVPERSTQSRRPFELAVLEALRPID